MLSLKIADTYYIFSLPSKWQQLKIENFKLSTTSKTETSKAKSLHYKTRVTLFTSLLNIAINAMVLYVHFLRDDFLLGQLFYISQWRCMLETIFKEGQEMVVKVLLPAQLRPIRGGLLSRHTTLLCIINLLLFCWQGSTKS